MTGVTAKHDVRGASRLKSLLDHLEIDIQVVGRDVRGPEVVYPLGTAGFSKFFCIIGGRGEHVVGGQAHAVAAGDLVFVPAGVEAVDNPVGRGTYAKIFCHFSARSAGMDLSGFLDVPAVVRPEAKVFAGLKRRFGELLERFNGTATCDGLQANAALRGILAQYLEAAPPAALRFRWTEALSKLDQVIAAMSADLAGEHRLEDLAKSVEVHPNHLCRLFTRSVGQPPHQYLKQLRLMRAQELLKTTEMAIEVVAAETGFANAQHFTKAFGERFGMPPAQFRKSVKTA
jgi:AraC-like DNA-binding protein